MKKQTFSRSLKHWRHEDQTREEQHSNGNSGAKNTTLPLATSAEKYQNGEVNQQKPSKESFIGTLRRLFTAKRSRSKREKERYEVISILPGSEKQTSESANSDNASLLMESSDGPELPLRLRPRGSLKGEREAPKIDSRLLRPSNSEEFLSRLDNGPSSESNDAEPSNNYTTTLPSPARVSAAVPVDDHHQEGDLPQAEAPAVPTRPVWAERNRKEIASFIYESVQHQPEKRSLTKELSKLAKQNWYWGPLTREEAEEKLLGQPDGAFLIRDSSDKNYLLSLSFRSHNNTLHTRIEHYNGQFSFYGPTQSSEGYCSILELVENSINDSQAGVFCYSRERGPGMRSFPVRLTKPLSRFQDVPSLQYLCRFVIREYIRRDLIQSLPLPPRIRLYLEENHFQLDDL